MSAAILFGISASGSLSQGNSISAADLRNIQTLKSELDSMNNNALNPYLEIMKNMLFKISSDKDMFFNSAIATLRINTFDTQIFFIVTQKNIIPALQGIHGNIQEMAEQPGTIAPNPLAMQAMLPRLLLSTNGIYTDVS